MPESTGKNAPTDEPRGDSRAGEYDVWREWKDRPERCPNPACDWVLELLNVNESDTLTDLFPGTGSMSEAYGRRTA